MADKKTGAAAPQQTKGSITKQEAVRRAVAALGKNALAKEIQKHVKEKFNLDMTIDHIYTAKSSVLGKKKKAATKPAADKPPAPQPAVAVASVRPAPAPVSSKQPGGISLEDLQSAKALLGRVGAEQLHRLIDLLAK